MSSHEIRSEHRVRVRAAVQRATELRTLRDSLQRDHKALGEEVNRLTSRLDTLSKVGELFRALMDRLVMEHVKSIESVVTEGLRTIFVDQNLTFEAKVSQRYNKIAIDFGLREDDEKMSVSAHPLEAFGGGPTSVVSIILKVLAMRRLGKWPLLALDETLGGVSEEYVDRTGLFLQELAQKTGFAILLITHKEAFLDHATVGYRAKQKIEEDGTRRLQLQR